MIPENPARAAQRNLLLLVQLRWLAVGGQLATILATQNLFGIALPLVPMLLIAGVLVLLNVTTVTLRRRRDPTNRHLLVALALDVLCLSAQLYLSGGATNPFVTLFLLQVVLGAVLLEAWSSWLLVALTSGAVAFLSIAHRPLALPPGVASLLSPGFLFASWLNFTLAAVLLVAFVTRIARNVRSRDAHLAALRQRAAEEEHIVRMGLLASGAAHELGTPLGSLSVALGDWQRLPAIVADPDLVAEVADMRAEVARCKDILAGILFAAGEVSGEAPAATTLRRFLTAVTERWSGSAMLTCTDHTGAEIAIVSDRALEQALTNLLDNAAEAGAQRITLLAERDKATLVLAVRDDGRGIPAPILANLGKPYNSSKPQRGAGLGLFLAVNVLRTLGGSLDARNRLTGGAEVTLRLPLDALLLPDEEKQP